MAWINLDGMKKRIMTANHIGAILITTLAISALTISISNVNVKIRMKI